MKEVFPGTCVAPSGEFVYGIHKPNFKSINLRENDYIVPLGRTSNKVIVDNGENFPDRDVEVRAGEWIFEIPNAFPFMGATFVLKSKADQTVERCNPFGEISERFTSDRDEPDFQDLSRAELMALASTSTDPKILASLAERSCEFIFDENTKMVSGRIYQEADTGELHEAILDRHLFQLVSNNPFLPEVYKQHMVLIPGAQGKSPIVGEYEEEDTHIWEYLRKNSYIPWGHYAANMAHDAVRYNISSLSLEDFTGLRHLYYQRIYVQLAAELGLPAPTGRKTLDKDELEALRLSLFSEIEQRNKSGAELPFSAIVWGQNFGFDLSISGYRLGGSHQQIHHQFALVPPHMPVFRHGENHTTVSAAPTYTQGDRIAQFTREYREKTGRSFFATYLKAIHSNVRLDGRADKARDLIIYQDENVVAFVPKAQRSQGEIQIMSKGECGNILEADKEVRSSLDRVMLLTMKVLENLGVEMFTAFEISKRLDNPDGDQRLLYCILPRHPMSPGGFSESQQRWISNYYPEDFAKSCRDELDKIMERG